MLILLIPVFILLVFVLLNGARESDDPYQPWQTHFLLAMGLWGATVVGISEILHVFNALSSGWLAFAWLVSSLILLFFGWRRRLLGRGWSRVRALPSLVRSYEYFFWGVLILITGIQFAVAWAAVPNNVDSLQYHMPRVMQWAQNDSLAHFPAVHLSQVARPYWAELSILHLRELSGSDQSANLVQWLSMLGSLVAASGITRLLGGGRRSQWLSVFFVMSIPMGALQAVTTQNDYVSAFWTIALAYFALSAASRPADPINLLGLSLTTGLGMLSKGTFYPYAAPLLGLFFLLRLWRQGWARTIRAGVLVAMVALSLNLPFLYRNIQTFGGPYGPNMPVEGLRSGAEDTDAITLLPSGRANSDSVTRIEDGLLASGASFSKLVSSDSRIRAASIRLARMVAMNFVTPIYAVNQMVFRMLEFFPGLFGEGFIEGLRSAAWNYEMTAGNPLHLIAGVISLIALSFSSHRIDGARGWPLALSAVSGFVLLSLITTSAILFSIRYQLGFYLLCGPAFGLVFGRMRPKLVYVLAAGFVLYTLPYVLLNNMRPVIGMQPWPTRVGSVFTTQKQEILFAQYPGFEDEFAAIVERIVESDCKQVGLALGHKDPEYLLWWLLNAHGSRIELMHIKSSPSLVPLIDESFAPCAVICTDCDGLERVYSEMREFNYGHIALHLR